MTDAYQVRCYGYVDRPYEKVRNLLRSRGEEVLQRATSTAGERARGLLTRLHIDAAGFELGVDVVVTITKRPDEEALAGLPPITHLGLTWHAAADRGLFPSLSAELSLSPMTFAETRVELDGFYRPPLSVVGKIFDAAAGHRIAEAAVHRLINDLVEQIRREVEPNDD